MTVSLAETRASAVGQLLGRHAVQDERDHPDRRTDRHRVHAQARERVSEGSAGIESVHAVKAKAGFEGKVMVQAGTYGGWEWDGTATDRWLGDFLASDQGKNKLGKLGRAVAAERHLVIVLGVWLAFIQLVWAVAGPSLR